MQTGTAGLQNIFDIDSIESRYENGMLGIESGSRKNAYWDQEETFQLEFMAQHTPPDHEKRQVNETMNEKTSFEKDTDTGFNKNPKVLKSVDSENGKLNKVQIDEKRKELLEALKKKKVLERLKEKGIETYKQNGLKKERIFLNEMASVRFRRKT